MGADNNALKASKGALRENGKIILVLNDDDLKKLYNLKMRQEEPSDYLMEKLDNMLIDLEK